MVYIKSEQEIEKMRKANSLVMKILLTLKDIIKPGLNIEVLEKKAIELTRKNGAIPAFKGYQGYPAALCVSINETIIHGIPYKKILKEGDIVSLDFGVLLNNFYGDAAITVPVGSVSKEAMRLINVTREALYRGIAMAIPGNRLGDISSAIQNYVEGNGFSVIRDFTGHGIGRNLHEDPAIPNFGKAGTGLKIEKGMTFALEPMVTAGSYEVEILHDGWTTVTKDGSLSAHFEHTIAVTETEPEILSTV